MSGLEISTSRVRPQRALAPVVLVPLLLLGCGSSKAPLVVSNTTTTTRADATSTTAAEHSDNPDEEPVTSGDQTNQSLVAAEAWIDITANLVGLESSCGNLSFVSAHPERDLVIAGVAEQGLWALEDGAEEWAPLGQGNGSDDITNRTSWIEYDPTSGDVYWQSGFYGDGAFRTDDGGETFEQLGDVDHLDYISVDLSDPLRQTMLAGRHEAAVVYRSADGGRTWADLSDRLPSGIGYATYPVVLDSMIHLLGTKDPPQAGDTQSGIFRSEDGGETWTRLYDGPVAGPPLMIDNAIYWLAARGRGLLVSTDGGASFELSRAPAGSQPANLVALPDGQLATVSGREVIVTDDRGETWRPVGPAVPFLPRGIAFSAARSAFYVWQWTCNASGEANAVPSEAVMQLGIELR